MLKFLKVAGGILLEFRDAGIAAELDFVVFMLNDHGLTHRTELLAGNNTGIERIRNNGRITFSIRIRLILLGARSRKESDDSNWNQCVFHII